MRLFRPDAEPAEWPAAPGATAYHLAAGVLITGYAICATPAASLAVFEAALPATRFGVSQIQRLGWPGLAALAAIVCLARPLSSSIRARDLLARAGHHAAGPAGRVGIGIIAASIFWLGRTRTMNADGAAFQALFEREAGARGVFATHDEILEFAVHSAAWRAAHDRWGWDVATTYQVCSVAAGAVFMLLLVAYARLVTPRQPLVFAALMLAGGYVQLFFGDVENYTLTAVAVLAYFVWAERFLQRRASVIAASLCLAVAMMCHLLAGFLLPSLVYLWWLAARRQTRRALRSAVLAFAGVIAATLAAAQFFWGLPIDRLLDSHAAGHGGDYSTVLAAPSLAHYWTQLNLLVLLAPAAVFLPALGNALASTDRHVHLALASGGMLLFLVVWEPALGPMGDWNLFANAAIPVSLLVWSHALTAPGVSGRRAAVTAAGLAAALHTAAWVWGNGRWSG